MLFHQDRERVTPQMSLKAASMVRIIEMAAKIRPIIAVMPIVPNGMFETILTISVTTASCETSAPC